MTARTRDALPRVEMAWHPTARDYRHGLDVQVRVTARLRLRRRACWMAGVLALVAAACAVLGTALLLVFAVAGGALGGAAGLLWGRVARRVVAARTTRLHSGHGTHTVVLGPDAVETRCGVASGSMSWELFPSYAETATHVVLLGPPEQRLSLALPKRCLAAPADLDRLRTLLDARCARQR